MTPSSRLVFRVERKVVQKLFPFKTLLFIQLNRFVEDLVTEFFLSFLEYRKRKERIWIPMIRHQTSLSSREGGIKKEARRSNLMTLKPQKGIYVYVSVGLSQAEY